MEIDVFSQHVPRCTQSTRNIDGTDTNTGTDIPTPTYTHAHTRTHAHTHTCTPNQAPASNRCRGPKASALQGRILSHREPNNHPVAQNSFRTWCRMCGKVRCLAREEQASVPREACVLTVWGARLAGCRVAYCICKAQMYSTYAHTLVHIMLKSAPALSLSPPPSFTFLLHLARLLPHVMSAFLPARPPAR